MEACSEKNAAPQEWNSSRLTWWFGQIFIFLVFGLYGWSVYVFVYLLSLQELGEHHEWLPWLSIPLYVAFLVLTAYSHLVCVFTDPGTVHLLPNLGDFEEGNQGTTSRKSFCQKCSLPRPERAHHCRTCNRCVLRMDHHCPWINNCVGYRNHKLFVVFTSYASMLGAIVTVFLALRYILDDFSFSRSLAVEIQFGVLFFTAAILGFMVLNLAVMHIDFFLRNLTTIETFNLGGSYENEYDLGSVKNWKQLCGNNPFLWCLPVYTSKGNGTAFPKAADREIRVYSLWVCIFYRVNWTER